MITRIGKWDVVEQRGPHYLLKTTTVYVNKKLKRPRKEYDHCGTIVTIQDGRMTCPIEHEGQRTKPHATSDISTRGVNKVAWIHYFGFAKDLFDRQFPRNKDAIHYAAPRLLEALRALLWQHDNVGHLCGMALQDARAAISQADGNY